MSNNTLTPVSIYTDGSCLGNPGPGGWAALLISGVHKKEISGGFKLTTNNRMELTGAIKGLEAITGPCSITLYTDSRYVCDAINKKWLQSWQKRGWKKADKKDVLNRDLWQRLVPLLEKHKPKLVWVEGHSGHPENERVDVLARTAAAGTGLPEDTGFKA
ncbi:ribonuclease HI [Desulfovibrio sp. OttesenSCG-928-F07]|nr:ribonuclease HI [Desulfovibrio sp. OttesenSCG-928-F07]